MLFIIKLYLNFESLTKKYIYTGLDRSVRLGSHGTTVD